MRSRALRLLFLAAAVAVPAVADVHPPAPPQAEKVRAEALALLGAWRDAQNQHDFARYIALYDKAHFKGVKRTRSGGVKRFDLAGWSEDRGRMFKSAPEVATEDVTVTTWLDAGSDLKSGVSQLRFVQRWRSPRYADHGVKLLQTWRDPVGRHSIIYEDLLNSEPGWEERPKDAPAIAIKAPRDEGEALAAWKKLAPTGADYAKKLAGLPSDTKVVRPLARALLAGGNFACRKVVETSECGQETVEWDTLDPAAGLDDPCLRRRLALWALEEGELGDNDIAGLSGELEGMLALKPPETELPAAVMARAAKLGRKHEPLRISLIVAAAKGGHADDAEKALDGLSPAGVVTAWRDAHLDAAALALDPKKQRAELLAALGDEKLDARTRSSLLVKVVDLDGKDVLAALRGVADEADDCGLAYEAAGALADKGDKSRLPRRPGGTDARAHGRALCMLMHESDDATRLARWKEFLPPRGKALMTEQIDDEFAERDEEGNRKDESPEPIAVTRKNAAARDLDSEWGEHGAPDCGGSTCKVEVGDGYIEITFEAAGDRLYIARIHRYRWRGCPC